MARRRRRGLSYLPAGPARTPATFYLVVAGLSLLAIFFFKNNMIKPVSGKVLDAYTGKPVMGATVLLENNTQLAHTAGISNTFTLSSDLDGSFRFEKATDNFSLSISAKNYRAEKLQTSQHNNITINLRPRTLRGVVKDPQGQPISNASITIGDRSTTSEQDGTYLLDDSPEDGQILVKASGYKILTTGFSKTNVVDITLQPMQNKGIYVAPLGVTDPAFFPNVLNLITSTELNSLVVDLKDSNGLTFFDSKNPLARPASESKGKIKDLPGFVKDLKSRGIYTIARISVFQDASLTDVKPELALKSHITGKLWADNARYNWSNPYNKTVWDYNISLAEEAVAAGFDEVQFTYVHFPLGGNLSDIDYGQESNASTRTQAITGFLKEANSRLTKLGKFLSVEVMGQGVLETGDLGIGQDISQMADQVDYISPILFPSYFGADSFGHVVPATQPYDVINRSVTFAYTKLQGKRALVRPWLQDFSTDGINYGSAEVRAEIQGAEDADKNFNMVPGWLLWNPDATYTMTALKKKT